MKERAKIYPARRTGEVTFFRFEEPRIRVRRSSGRTVAPPAGFEPALPPPEGGALSPELRGQQRLRLAVGMPSYRIEFSVAAWLR